MAIPETLPNTVVVGDSDDGYHFRIGKHKDCENCDAFGVWSNDDISINHVNNNWDNVKKERIEKNDKDSDICIMPCANCLHSIDWQWEFNDLFENSLGRDLRTGFIHTKHSFCVELLEQFAEAKENVLISSDYLMSVDEIASTFVPWDVIDYFYEVSAHPPWEASQDETCSSECSDGEDSW
jgi:hypothetical protein